ncbi:MAG: ABC transporter substrate-binding protein [Anaerolineae bacterium]|nr:ABC transporter substrate-binding protein [Anaerolineae bacterium]
MLVLVGSGVSCRPSPKVYRVGVLSGLAFIAPAVDGFKTRMTELGYVEGQNILYDVQSATVDVAAYRRILQQFVENQVDLIFVFPTEATLEAKAATQGTDIPVVFCYVVVEDTGVVNSVREPGGNITGVRYPGPEIMLKRFEVMQRIAPHARRILLPYWRNYPTIPSQLKVLRPAAEAVGVSLIEAPIESAAELEQVLQSHRLADGSLDIDAILFMNDPVAIMPETFLVAARFADQHRIPIGGAPMEVENYRPLYDLLVDPYTSGRLAAFLADKILRGTPAGTLPVVSPEPYLRINYRRALELGLLVPESLLAEADEVLR